MVSFLTTLFLGSLPEAVYQYLVPILFRATDNLLFLSKRKREINFPRKNMLEARVHLRTACIRSRHTTDGATAPWLLTQRFCVF